MTIPKIDRRSLLSSLCGLLALPFAGRAKAAAPQKRYAILTGTSMFGLRSGCGVEGVAQLIAGDLEHDRIRCKLIPATPSLDELAGQPFQDRYIGLHPMVLVGTIDELVADYRQGLEIVAARFADPAVCRDNNVDPEAHEAELLRLNLDGPVKVTHITRDRIQARRAAKNLAAPPASKDLGPVAEGWERADLVEDIRGVRYEVLAQARIRPEPSNG